MNNDYLMRRIQYTPSYVKIYCDIPIKFLQEIYFNSIVYLPKVIFNEKKFQKYEIIDDYIKVDIVEWSKFVEKLVLVFEGKNINKIRQNITQKLKSFSNYVNKCFGKKRITGKEFLKLVDYMCQADSFAIFNMYIPVEKYKSKLLEENTKLHLEDVMVCSFEPHRLQLRKEKLILALKYKKSIIDETDYIKYYNNYVFYEEFEKWLFDTEKYTNRLFLNRELRNIDKKYTENELLAEINTIEKNRKNCLKRALNFASQIKSDNLLKYTFLSTIVSEEELRHMIECKLLLLWGIQFNNMDIDVGRSSIKELYVAFERSY